MVVFDVPGIYSWMPPDGVSSERVNVYGAEGESVGSVPGGLGAEVTATVQFPQGSGAPSITVGESGAVGAQTNPLNGGGQQSGILFGATTIDNIVAGGGGGAGASGSEVTVSNGTVTTAPPLGGAGGNADSPGQPGQGGQSRFDNPPLMATATGGGGGGGATATTAGAGGAGASGTDCATGAFWSVPSGEVGGSGQLGGAAGTSGTAIGNPGGGGGYGWIGGGGGGAGPRFVGNAASCQLTTGGGGEGGGASFLSPGISGTIVDGVASPDDPGGGEVIVTYANVGPPPSVPEFPSLPLTLAIATFLFGGAVWQMQRRRSLSQGVS